MDLIDRGGNSSICGLQLHAFENRPFANRQIHQSQFHWKWFEIDHELIFQ